MSLHTSLDGSETVLSGCMCKAHRDVSQEKFSLNFYKSGLYKLLNLDGELILMPMQIFSFFSFLGTLQSGEHVGMK